MTVEELIDHLRDFPMDFEVMVSVDEEGNEFKAIDTLDHAYYDEEDDDITFYVLSDEDDEDSVEEQIALEESNVVLIWPVG